MAMATKNVSTKLLGEIGDLSAPPGSKEWAIAVRLELWGLLKDREVAKKHLAPYLRLMDEHEGYKQLPDPAGTEFVSVEDFLNAPYPYGLGGQVEQDEREGYKLRARGRPAKDNKGVNSHLYRGTGNKSYILARLERDHPDILAAFHAGEYNSARQAGIAAGFIKDVKRIQVEARPDKIAARLKAVLSDDQIAELIQLLRLPGSQF